MRSTRPTRRDATTARAGLIGRYDVQRHRVRVGNERGAAAVELALLLFPLLMLMLGIVEFGRVYSLQLRLQQAARESAREVALHYDDPGIDADALASLANTTLTDLLGSSLVGDLDTTSIVLCTAPTGDAVVTLGDEVDLAIPMPDDSPLGAIDVAAKAQMPCEG